MFGNNHYILQGRQAVSVDLMTWAKWFEISNRRIGEDVLHGVRVSTVFLGLDHNWGEGPPLIFETMIFGGWHDDYQERYSTYEEAEAGHRRALILVSRLWWISPSMQQLVSKMLSDVRSWWWGLRRALRRSAEPKC